MTILCYRDIFRENFSFHIADTVFYEKQSFVHHHDFYEFFLVVQGKLLHHLNGMIFELNEGSLTFIHPSDMHCFENKKKSEPASIINVAFTKEELQKVFDFLCIEDIKFKPNQSIHLEYYTSISIKRNINKLFENFLYENKESLLQQFKLLLAEVCFAFFQASQLAKTQIPSWLMYACDEMKQKSNYKEGISKLIELSGKSQEHLTRTMKKHLGKTPSEFINDLRISNAATDLRQTRKSVLDVMFEHGFENTSYFNRLFKERFGTSPLKFRKTNRNIL